MVTAFLAGMAVLAAAPPTGLAPGTAKGTITVNGKAVAITHAYAALEQNPDDEKRNDIVVLLTDRPLDAAALAGNLSEAGLATKGCNYLQLKLGERPEHAKQFGFLGNWVITSRFILHDETVIESALDFASKVDAVVVGPDRVEGTIYTAKVEEDLGEKFEYRVSFNANVKPRAAAK